MTAKTNGVTGSPQAHYPTNQEQGKDTNNWHTVSVEQNTDLNDLMGEIRGEIQQQTGPVTDGVSTYHRTDAIIAESRILLSDAIPPPTICLAFGYSERIVATLGNFTVVAGKAKSRKTFLVCCIVAAFMSEEYVISHIRGRLPRQQPTVLLIDTEQGKYHVQLMMKRIQALSGRENLPNLLVYSLRPYSTVERLDVIRKLVCTTHNLGAVIIDGIRDTVFDINDQKEAVERATDLLQWTEQQSIFLLTVIHENKADKNLRGHLGAELTNKAETVISVSKEKGSDCSDVKPEYCRNRDFEPFSFSVDESGTPYLVDVIADVSLSEGKAKSKQDTDMMTPEQVDSVVRRAFANDEYLGYGQLRTNILEGSQHIGKTLSKHEAELLITRLVNTQIFYKQRPGGKGHEKYYLTAANDCPK